MTPRLVAGLGMFAALTLGFSACGSGAATRADHSPDSTATSRAQLDRQWRADLQVRNGQDVGDAAFQKHRQIFLGDGNSGGVCRDSDVDLAVLETQIVAGGQELSTWERDIKFACPDQLARFIEFEPAKH